MLLTMRPTGGHSPVYAGRQDWTIFDDERNVMLRHACKLDLEGIVSKRLGSRYRGGRSRDWLKVKNPDAPAGKREAEAHRSRIAVSSIAVGDSFMLNLERSSLQAQQHGP